MTTRTGPFLDGPHAGGELSSTCALVEQVYEVDGTFAVAQYLWNEERGGFVFWPPMVVRRRALRARIADRIRRWTQ